MSTYSDFSLATRRRFMLAAAASGLGTAVPSLAWAQDKPQKGGTLNLLLFPEPPTLTTIAHTAGSSVTISGKVTEGLLTYDFNLNPQPQLAVAWTISPDGLVYRFQLRQGVKWHDGKPFTSADVVHSIGLLKEFHPRGRATFAGVAEVQAPDAHTVVLQLSRPIPYLITALAASESPIVPKHLYASGRADTNPANNAPVGTGPFVFKEWVRGSHVIYERNPHYWGWRQALYRPAGGAFYPRRRRAHRGHRERPGADCTQLAGALCRGGAPARQAGPAVRDPGL
jgi:peptide/nickel transport system substrate-binding protein